MRADLRQKEILELLQSQHQISVTVLAERFHVSAMTIRRDLDVLEEKRLLKREHGRAVHCAQYVDAPQYERRLVSNAESKDHIAKLAVQFLPGMNSLYVDGSTTCHAFLKALPPDASLTVYTNSIPAVNLLMDRPNIRTFLFGGMLSPSMRHLDSTSSILRLSDIFVDAAFISCSGYTDKSIINYDILTVNERRIMLKNARTRFLLADAQKYEKTGVFTVCDWSDIDVFITDRQPAPDLAGELSACRVKTLY